MSRSILFMTLFAARCAAEELTCIACTSGYYLDHESITCRHCPANMSTFTNTNATRATDCMCEAGLFNSTEACVPCSLGTFKTLLANTTCTQCMPNANTTNTGNVDPAQCLCNPGFTVTSAKSPSESCISCSPGSFKDWLGDETCTACPANSYCPRKSITPTPCPANSISSSLAGSVYDCTCMPGFHHHFTHSEPPSLVCVPCETGTYTEAYNTTTCDKCHSNSFFNRTGASSITDCVQCPENSVSEPGSSNITQCFCVLGYAGMPGDACVACAPGFFRDDPTQYICTACGPDTYNGLYSRNQSLDCLQCPPDQTSPSGSDAELDCVCREGRYATISADGSRWVCHLCAPGTFQNQINASSCTECPPGTASSVAGANHSTTCAPCNSGYHAIQPAATQCSACTPGEWQNLADPAWRSSPCEPCPGNSTHSLTASTNIHDCVCSTGFVKYSSADVSNRCERCRPGSFCPGNGTQVACSYNSWSPGGVFPGPCVQCAALSRAINDGNTVGRHQCQCVPGSEGAYDSECALCVPGKFQPLNYTYPDGADFVADMDVAVATACRPCPIGSYSDAAGAYACKSCPVHSNASVGTDALTGCVCVPGYYGPDGGPCEGCPADSFCLGGVAATQCRPHSKSPPLSSAPADCKCDPGYYSSASNITCRKCPAGFYCHGDQHIEACAANSSSLAGASAASACTCAPGMWRECILQHATGVYLNSNGQPCVIEWLAECVACGENNICIENTLLHCPMHSTSPVGSSDQHDCVCDDGYYNIFHHTTDDSSHDMTYEHDGR